jgi:hypothetical protein
MSTCNSLPDILTEFARGKIVYGQAERQIKDLMVELVNEALRTEPKTQSDLYRAMRQKINEL